MHPRHLLCPVCGSDRLHWELHRVATRNPRITSRVLCWSCRACALSWTAPLERPSEGLVMEDLPASP